MQRLRIDEANEVVRLAAERRASTADEGPTLEGLSVALGLPVAEVERLLVQVRASREVPRRRFGDRSAAISAALVLAISLVVVAVLGFRYWSIKETQPAAISVVPEPPNPSVVIEDHEGGRIIVPGDGTVPHIQLREHDFVR